MRRILTTGFFACFLIGIVYLFFKILVVDALEPIFRPLIVRLTDRDYLSIPMTLLFTLILVVIAGALLTRIQIQSVFNKYLRKVPKDLEKGRGGLVMLGQDTYFLAVIIKEISFQRASGKLESFYVLYGPSSPLPWSGLPILFVKKENVIPLKISFGEIYSITGSFGGTAPGLLTELKAAGYLDLAGEEAKSDK